VTVHPLRRVLDAAARGAFPPMDGRIEVVGSTGGRTDAIVAFTAHFVLAADVDAAEIAAHVPDGELSRPLSPSFLGWLRDRYGLTAASQDALFVAIGDAGGAPPWLRRDDSVEHPRVERASRSRAIDAVWWTDDGSVVMVGRGLCGRWEVGYEVAPDARGKGAGRRLVAAAKGLVPEGEPLWAQVAPGNAASMRSTLAAGFVPVAAEVLLTRDQ
jgi:GNAT superfamily N-acetyltransferase